MSEKQIVTREPKEYYGRAPKKPVVEQLEKALESARKAEQATASKRSAAEKQLAKMQAVAIKLRAQDDATTLELGKLLIDIRGMMKALDRGDWTLWYTEAGFKENRVNYCIRVAEGKVTKEKKVDPRGPTPRTPSGKIAWKAYMKVNYKHERTMFESACYRSASFKSDMTRGIIHTIEQLSQALECDGRIPAIKEVSAPFGEALKALAAAMWEHRQTFPKPEKAKAEHA